jgi:elongation factor Ts
MAEIKPADVKRLRDATGAGMMDCKKALLDADGDFEKAKDLLRERGIADSKKYSQRSAQEGVVESYLHKPDPSMPAKLGVLVELNCATDFVAKTERFQTLAREIALHVSFADPAYVKRDDFPGDVIEREKEIYRKQAEGKPEHVVEKMVEGKLNAFFASIPGGALLDQPYVRDDKKTVGQMLDETSAELKEPVLIRRFARFKVGVD